MNDRMAAAIAELAAAITEAAAADVPAPGPDRLYSIAEAGAMLGGVGRTSIYGLLDSGALRSVRVGRRRLIAAGAIRDYIEARS